MPELIRQFLDEPRVLIAEERRSVEKDLQLVITWAFVGLGFKESLQPL